MGETEWRNGKGLKSLAVDLEGCRLRIGNGAAVFVEEKRV